MRRVSISARAARELLLLVGEHPWSDRAEMQIRAQRELESALRPSAKKTAAKRARRADKDRVRSEHAANTAKVRASVMSRAGGKCEACAREVGDYPARVDLDHFWGRGRGRQRLQNCWALCPDCHYLKTLNDPNAEHWLKAFQEHCRKHRYWSELAQAQRRLDGIVAVRNAEAAR